MRVDAGRGSWEAPEGSPEWAKRLRLAWLSTKHELTKYPELFVKYFRKAVETRAWTVMTDEHGNTFPTFEAFCRAPEPWGFGQPWSEIRPYLLGVISERDLDVVTIAPEPPKNTVGLKRDAGPGRGNKTDRPLGGRTVSPRPPQHTREAQLRAIAERAPEPARELYKRGLLGQKEAAKLGPKNPSPEDAERVTRIAIELAEYAKQLDTTTEAARKQAQPALNVKARTLLGLRHDRVGEALRAIEKLSEDERSRLFEAARERGWL